VPCCNVRAVVLLEFFKIKVDSDMEEISQMAQYGEDVMRYN